MLKIFEIEPKRMGIVLVVLLLIVCGLTKLICVGSCKGNERICEKYSLKECQHYGMCDRSNENATEAGCLCREGYLGEFCEIDNTRFTVEHGKCRYATNLSEEYCLCEWGWKGDRCSIAGFNYWKIIFIAIHVFIIAAMGGLIAFGIYAMLCPIEIELGTDSIENKEKSE